METPMGETTPSSSQATSAEVLALRAQMRMILEEAVGAKLITDRVRQVMERRFGLHRESSLEKPYETHASIAHDLQVSTTRIGEIQYLGLGRLRTWPAFREAMNRYLARFPYRRPWPKWLNENGQIHEDDHRWR